MFFCFASSLEKSRKTENQNPREVSNANRAIRISHRVPTHEVGLRPKTRFTTSGPRWLRSKLAQNASRYFTASSTSMWTLEAIRNPTPKPEKPFRASFPQKTAEHAKETVCRCTNFVQISKTTPTRTPLFFMISTFQHNHRKRVPIKGFCFELRFRRNRAKNANWKIQFSRNQFALISRIFRTDKGTQFASN